MARLPVPPQRRRLRRGNEPVRQLERYGVDGFLLSLIGAMALAWLLPDAGRSGGWLHLDLFTSYGIGFIFFLLGINLDLGMVRAEIGNWRLHLVTQGVSFVLFPLLMLVLLGLAGAGLDRATRDGMFFLAVLPGGVSSVVASTTLARGNMLGALFNGTLSILAGVVVTPLWMEWYLAQNAEPLDLEAVIFRLGVLVLIPCLAGIAARPLVLPRFSRLMKTVSGFDRVTIISMMANAYADSIVDGDWATIGPGRIALVFLLSLAMLGIVALCTLLFARRVGLDRESTIAALFCGTKKALGSGVRMAEVLLAGSPVIGVILLPIMIYHFQQLVLAAIVARWLANDGRLEAAIVRRVLRRFAALMSRWGLPGAAIALAGAAVADMLGWPAPLLLGSTLAVAAAALTGLPVLPPRIMTDTTAAALGLLLGGQAIATGAAGLAANAVLVALLIAGITPILAVPLGRLLNTGAAVTTDAPGIRAIGQLTALCLAPLFFAALGWLPRAPLALSWGKAGDIALALPPLIAVGLMLRRLRLTEPWLIAGLFTGAASGLIFADGITVATPVVAVIGQIAAGQIIGARLFGLDWSSAARILPRATVAALPRIAATIAIGAALVAAGIGDPSLIALLATPSGALEGAALALALAPGTCGALAIAAAVRALASDLILCVVQRDYIGGNDPPPVPDG